MNALRVIGLAASLSLSTVSLGADVKPEGRGKHREKMDAMQGAAFDHTTWRSLNSWMGTAPLTADALNGKVVCIITWASWNNGSAKALQAAQKLHEEHKGQGLVVVGVHDRNGWENAAQTMGSSKVNFIVAHDEKGEFTKQIGSDAHPDIFLIDRAGNMRYADIMTDSLGDAVTQLVAESAEQAKAAAGAPKTDAADKGAKRKGKYDAPPASAYASAKWPTVNSGQLSATNLQGKPLPGGGLGQEKYLTDKPDREGKVTVIDFWATWCGPCVAAMPHLDTLQKEHKDDVVVMGLSSESEDKVKSFLAKKKHEYTQAIDLNGRLNNAMGVRGIPHIVVLSSDGVIRWQGHPMDPGFKASIKTLLDVDPGVKARREAEKRR